MLPPVLVKKLHRRQTQQNHNDFVHVTKFLPSTGVDSALIVGCRDLQTYLDAHWDHEPVWRSATGPSVAVTSKTPQPKAARRDVGRSGSWFVEK